MNDYREARRHYREGFDRAVTLACEAACRYCATGDDPAGGTGNRSHFWWHTLTVLAGGDREAHTVRVFCDASAIIEAANEERERPNSEWDTAP